MTKSVIANKEVLVDKMLKSGVHYGHSRSRWNPRMSPFVFGLRHNIHIIDLNKTLEKLEEAIAFIQSVVKSGQKILFLGTEVNSRQAVERIGKKTSMPYNNQRWIGGTFTNFGVISKQIQRLEEMRQFRASEEYKKLSKKQKHDFDKQFEKIEAKWGGLEGLKEYPGAIFIVDLSKNIIAAQEARAVNIPIVALVDTDNDPSQIDYPIPANNDSMASVDLIMGIIEKAILKAK